VHITKARLLRVEEFFARHGLATILIGRFVGLVRPVAPFLAGASRYPAGRFAAVALFGTGLWAGALVLLGFLFWQSFDQALEIAKQGTLAVDATVALAACAIFAYRLVRARRTARREGQPDGRSRTVVAEPEGAG
jgi:membrane protein DedA with SNARE-associated domain